VTVLTVSTWRVGLVETGRPSEIEIELHGDEVVLRGEAVVAAAGTLQLPVS